ncbi:MAG: SDR family oxidoreductase [Rivularia sp. (in: Bacteria)]|nr:SDR family oxidoreductase [Rivularia sp. MS3]
MNSPELDNSIPAIAIIGMSGRFPGANDIKKFWENLCSGVESISNFTDAELTASGVDSELLNHPKYVKRIALLDNIDLFDAAFFGFNPKEAELTNPQHRLFLESAWEALENAGYDSQRCEIPIGVYAGASSNSYSSRVNQDKAGLASIFQTGIGNDNDFLATRVSYKLNLTGPSLTLQTACSTSLVATTLACQSLLNYQCDMALAGGVSINILQKTGYLYQEGGILSPDGHCRAFDAQARGTIIGNGVGVVVLKRLAEAIADGDHIYAVIKGSAINNDGSGKVGYTAPSVNGQSQVIAEALALADVEPETISYIEAHGTGTVLGDPIEISALTGVFGESSDQKQFCAIGSVKTNIGHLDAAAGVAGLIKTALALKHEQIPPSLNFEQPNPEIDFANSPFYVNTKLREWETTPRRAGVSSLGIGGTNAHVILEEAPTLEESSNSRSSQLLLLSAKTESALDITTKNLVEHLRANPESKLADIAYTLQTGRAEFDYRRILVCENITDAINGLENLEPKKVLTHFCEAKQHPITFMFPGQGSQYINMAGEIYKTETRFREIVDNCCAILIKHLGFDLRRLIYPQESQREAAAEKLKQTDIAQPALFVIEYALAQLWMSWGITPQAMIGHSIGEYVAACIAGVISLEDALMLVANRGKLMQQMAPGIMLSIQLPEAEVKPLLNEEFSLASSNAPSLCVVSGTDNAIDSLHKRLAAKGIECRRLHTSHAFHSQMMEPALKPFIKMANIIQFKAPQIPFISNVTGTWITAEQATDVNYWAQHLRQTVQFSAGISTLLAEPNRILLEVGPGRTLSTLVKQHSGQQRGQIALTCLRHPKEQYSDIAFILNTLGQLWLKGVCINWSSFYERERRHRLPLPTYPFERQRYWIEPQEKANSFNQYQVSSNEKLDVTDWFNIPSWKRSVAVRPVASEKLMESNYCWLVFIDDCGIGNQILEQLESDYENIITVKIGEEFSQISDKEYRISPCSRDDYDSLFKTIVDSGKIPHKIIHFWNITPFEKRQKAEVSQIDDFDNFQDISFYSILFLVQALAEQNITKSLNIDVVSNNMQQVFDEKYLCPEKATILGLCKVIPQEYSNIYCRSIDIDLFQVDSEQRQQLIDNLLLELVSINSDKVIAYRGNQRWVRCFEALPIESQTLSTNKLRKQGVYVITGGLGEIGLVFAEYLANTVQAKLVLIGRSGLPPHSEWEELISNKNNDDLLKRKIEKVQHLKELGAEVLVLKADVANLEQMQNAMNQIQNRFGTIHGVIHAAGVPGAGIIQLKTPESVAKVFQPKLKGTLVLNAVLQNINLDFFVLFSSNTAITGGMGQVDYCAVNAFLDAFAHYNYYQKQNKTISINWDWWQGNNWADLLMSGIPGLQAEFKQMREKYGINFTEGTDALNRILSINQPQVVVSTQNLTTAIERVNDLTKFINTEKTSIDNLSSGKHSRPVLSSDFVEPSNAVEQKIANLWQQLLGIEKIGVEDNFFDLGGHSLIATQLVSQLRQDFQVEISLSHIFTAPTIAELALFIEDVLIGELEELTEDEAEMLVVNSNE